MADVSVLIPTFNRHAALAVTLTSLCYQEHADFDIVIADQSHEPIDEDHSPVTTALHVLALRGIDVSILRNLPRRGMAQQRQFLLDRSTSEFSLFLDDDLIVEPYVIELLARTLREQQCGFVGNAVIGLSYRNDRRPHEQHVERWAGDVLPERVTPESREWQRHRLHNAANILHVQERLATTPENPVLYKVAWVGGCVMYDTQKLRDVGGFEFWRDLPSRHCGEDVLAQLRVAAAYGGCGVMPSGAYHQELETTVPDRRFNAPEFLDL